MDSCLLHLNDRVQPETLVRSLEVGSAPFPSDLSPSFLRMIRRGPKEKLLPRCPPSLGHVDWMVVTIALPGPPAAKMKGTGA